MTTTSNNFYKQVFSDSDRWVSPKSRQEILWKYFQRYLPYFSQTYAESLKRFIEWSISYEDMLDIFTSTMISGSVQMRVAYYLEAYSPWYSFWESYLPPIRRKPFIQKELQRFIGVFGPNHQKQASRVPGKSWETIDQVHEILEHGIFLS